MKNIKTRKPLSTIFNQISLQRYYDYPVETKNNA